MRKTKKNLVVAYKFFNTDEGQMILDDLKKKALLLTGGIDTTNPIDVNKLLVHEGRADVVKYIFQMAGKDPFEEREKFAKTGE